MVKVEHEKVDLLVEQEPPQPPPKEEPQKKSRRRELWKWTKFGEKSGWDWMELLIIPLVLALGGLLFSLAQDTRQQEIEERRAQAQRAAEEQRAQDEALQAHLEGMGSLLLDEDLRSSKADDEVRTLAEARTSTVLSRLDGSRKRSVVLFLYKSKLIQKDQPIVPLVDVDLSDADLRDANLSEVNLSDADLSDADLSDADLRYADLSDARGITSEDLEKQAKSLGRTTMPDKTKHD